MAASQSSVRKVAWWLGGLGILSLGAYWWPASWALAPLVAALYPNMSTSLLSISLTVLLIDKLYEQRDAAEHKKRLTWEMGSSDPAQSGRAVKELRDIGILTDGGLAEADLSAANLENANLTEAILTNVNLTNASLKRADLTKASLRGAMLDGCAAEKVILKGADLTGASLRRAQLPDAILDDAKLDGTIDLLKARLAGASLRSANLRGARLEECDLLHTDFSNATLSEADLQGSDLDEALLEGADLERANLNNVQNWDRIRGIRDAKIAGIRNAPAGFKAWAIGNGATE